MTKNDKIIYSCWLLTSITLIYMTWFGGDFLNTNILAFSLVFGYSLHIAWLVYEGFSAKLTIYKYLATGIISILITTLAMGFIFEIKEGCFGSCVEIGIMTFAFSETFFILFAVIVRGIRRIA